MNVALEVEGLAKAYVPGRWVVRGLSLRLESGDSLAVVGANGVGKTTLIKLLAGLLEPTAGRVRLWSEGRQAAPAEVLSRWIGIATPAMQLYGEFRVEELLRLGARLRTCAVLDERIAQVLERLQLSAVAQQRIEALSSGMQQRVRIALALVHSPWLLLLDEATATLDTAGIAALEELVGEHCRYGGILVAATNAEHERRWCQRVLDLSEMRG
jgi:ABC-type multidrug transport system ATPase subunit